MTGDPAVRPARRDEHVALATLTVAAYRGLADLDLDERYLAELAEVDAWAASAEVLVATVDGRVVGGVAYMAEPGPLAHVEPGEATFRYLAVDPAEQGRGAGAALIQACVERARACGKGRVTLHTTEAMTAARRLYERAGFGREPGRDRRLDSGLLLIAYSLDLGD